MEKIVKLNLEIEENDIGKRLDIFLSEKLPDKSRSSIQKLIKEEKVYDENGKNYKSSYKIIKKCTINVDLPDENEKTEITPQKMDIDVLYEDEDIAIIDKKNDVVVHPGHNNNEDTLVNGLLYHFKELSNIGGEDRPGIVHRLDKDTSGVVIIAKNNNIHEKLVDLFKENKVKKTYITIVKGRLVEKKGKIISLIGRNPKNRKQMAVVSENGKNAITNYKVLEEVDNFSFLEVNIETGRTHQIRVHMKYLNKPVLGDEVYGRKTELAPRQMLHAYKLEFIHPITNKLIKVKSEVPEDFKIVYDKIGFTYDISTI